MLFRARNAVTNPPDSSAAIQHERRYINICSPIAKVSEGGVLQRKSSGENCALIFHLGPALQMVTGRRISFVRVTPDGT